PSLRVEGEAQRDDPNPSSQGNLARVPGDPRRRVMFADEQSDAELLADLSRERRRRVDTTNHVGDTRNDGLLDRLEGGRIANGARSSEVRIGWELGNGPPQTVQVMAKVSFREPDERKAGTRLPNPSRERGILGSARSRGRHVGSSL